MEKNCEREQELKYINNSLSGLGITLRNLIPYVSQDIKKPSDIAFFGLQQWLLKCTDNQKCQFACHILVNLALKRENKAAAAQYYQAHLDFELQRLMATPLDGLLVKIKYEGRHKPCGVCVPLVNNIYSFDQLKSNYLIPIQECEVFEKGQRPCLNYSPYMATWGE